MFVQTIRARTSDPAAMRAAMERWLTDLAPGAVGWLGSTVGVTEDGQLFVMARFESEEAARANSERPEQDAFWSDVAAALDGEATFEDSTDVDVQESGDPDTAQFVQVICGRTTDLARSNQIMAEHRPEMEEMRPEILGGVTVGHDGGRYTSVLYFTNEAEARVGEKKELPPEAKEVMNELMSLELGEPEFLDLKDPWLQSPK